MSLKIPWISDDELKRTAQKFLREQHPNGSIPVPIEEIAELKLNLKIIPVPGLRKILGVDGFIYSDFSSITIDEFVYTKFENRTRFTVAHELGHTCLHRKIYSNLSLTSLDEYRTFQNSIAAKDYGRLEYQANSFAGLVLVPSKQLKNSLLELLSGKVLKRKKSIEGLTYSLVEELAFKFQVSSQVILRRLEKDRLIPKQHS